jgi:hypothetical protein
MKHLLCKVPIFAGLDDDALKIFLQHAKRIGAQDGEVINNTYEFHTGLIHFDPP